MRLTLLLMIGVAMVMAAGAAQCDVVWDESVNGDLPSRTFPAGLGTLAPGNNVVLGAIGTSLSSDREDSATFTVAPGQKLSKVIFGPYDFGQHVDYVPFILYRQGEQEPTAMLLVNKLAEGVDLLQASYGQPGPQPAGTYSFVWQTLVQDYLADEKSSYQVSFVVEPVPEPSSLLVVSSLLMAVTIRRRSHAI